MPQVDFTIRIYNKLLTLENQVGADNDNTVYVHVTDNGQYFLETRQPADTYTGGAAGYAVSVESKRLAYGAATDEALAATILANELSGDGLIDVVIFDTELVSNSDSERRAAVELALRQGVRGQFSFSTYEDVEIGMNVRFIDETDGIDITWPIQSINFAIIGNRLEHQCVCSPSVEINAFQKADRAYRKTLMPRPKGKVSIPAL